MIRKAHGEIKLENGWLIMLVRDIYWLAGILEGEGCFNFTGHSMQLRCAMTDKDTMEKVSNLLRGKIHSGHTPAGKPYYSIQINGINAYQFMCMLYPLMGNRRREKIREIITKQLSRWPLKYTRNALGQYSYAG